MALAVAEGKGVHGEALTLRNREDCRRIETTAQEHDGGRLSAFGFLGELWVHGIGFFPESYTRFALRAPLECLEQLRGARPSSCAFFAVRGAMAMSSSLGGR